MRTFGILALAALLTTTSAQVYQGFNYGSIFTNNAPITEQEYERLFNTAKQLQGTSGAFQAARLFTTIQAGTTNSPIEAIAAAEATQTRLLLGIFLSSTEEQFNNELTALRSAITQFGERLVDIVIAISVGSEDLYRISPTGILNRSNPGEGPDAVVRRINAVRQALAGTVLSGKPIGHVDTWTAWVNSSNSAVIEASDFIGVDAYPYFQNTQANSIENGESLFFDAYNATVAVSGGKPVWITETGWPVSGPTENQAVPSLENARTYWDEVGCRVFGQINTFWYTLQDAFPNAPSPSFGVVGSTLSNTPLYDLTCPDDSSSSSSSSSSADPSTSSSAVISSSATGAPQTPVDRETAPTPPAPQGPQSPGGSSGSFAVQNTVAASVETTLATVATPPSSPAPSSTARSCPANLAGPFEFPHLIVPVDKNQPDVALGTSYNGRVSSTVSSLYNFDLPSSLAGKFCSLVFLFPTRDQLRTSNYTLSGAGGLSFERLDSPADSATTFNNQPEINGTVGAITDLQPGNSYVIGSGGCFAGFRVGYKVSAIGSLDLDYFQNFDPSPIGLYIVSC
ncbi:MAG: hypothetical protein Q9172_005865 [Xanthocarpia lactea]